VLGFAPTIDQAFGYGRGVHNLMRAIHSDPAAWAELAGNPEALKARLQQLIDAGLFYLRYTTGDPLENMRAKAKKVIADYVDTYRDELLRLKFEPEKEFETLIEEEQTLISGAIDVVRLDDPPRVAIIDFKSGEAESDLKIKLDEFEAKLQIQLYAMAAKKELEYEPEVGLVRYLGEEDPGTKELRVAIDEAGRADASRIIAAASRQIRQREFSSGPQRGARDPRHTIRCEECDFLSFCGQREARDLRTRRPTKRRPRT